MWLPDWPASAVPLLKTGSEWQHPQPSFSNFQVLDFNLLYIKSQTAVNVCFIPFLLIGPVMLFGVMSPLMLSSEFLSFLLLRCIWLSVMLSHVMTGGVPKRQLFFLRTGTGSLCQQCYSVRSASLVPFVPITLVAFTVQFLLQKFAVRKCQSLLCHFYSVLISQTCCCTQRDVWCEIDCSMCSSSVWAGVCAPQAAAVCSKVMLTALS